MDVDLDSHQVMVFGNQENENELVNVNMNGDTKALQNLRKKRQIELGMGRAGEYVGYDDDEFDAMGGVGTSVGGGMLRSMMEGRMVVNHHPRGALPLAPMERPKRKRSIRAVTTS